MARARRKGRIELLRKVSSKFAENKQKFGELEHAKMGMPLKEVFDDFDFSLDYFNSYLDTAEEHLKSIVTLETIKKYTKYLKNLMVLPPALCMELPFRKLCMAMRAKSHSWQYYRI